jgi:hypothetical protein
MTLHIKYQVYKKKLVLHFSQYGRSHAAAMSFKILLLLIPTVLLLLLRFGIINIILILLQQQQIKCIKIPAVQIQEFEIGQWEYNQPFIKQKEKLVEMYSVLETRNMNIYKSGNTCGSCCD